MNTLRLWALLLCVSCSSSSSSSGPATNETTETPDAAASDAGDGGTECLQARFCGSQFVYRCETGFAVGPESGPETFFPCDGATLRDYPNEACLAAAQEASAAVGCGSDLYWLGPWEGGAP